MNQEESNQLAKQTVDKLRESFKSQKTKDIAFRKQQLESLLLGINQMQDELRQALEKDLGHKEHSMIQMTQIEASCAPIKQMIDNIEEYSKPRFVETNLGAGNSNFSVLPEPYGVTFVMGAWNYLIINCICPAAEAIAAGNTVCLKPSELAPNLSAFTKKLFEKYLDNDCYKVLEGGIEIVKALQAQKWDLIIFTGSPEKGKLVAIEAAKNLTPVILELGGKSPTIIDQCADMDMAAKRITSTKFSNCGQTCIAPDYLIVNKNIQEEFLSHLKTQIEKQWGQDAQKSIDYGRIINENHTKRLENMIQTSEGQIVYGGKLDVQDKYIQPSLILEPSMDSALMKEEIFGPILPILTFNEIEEAIEIINNKEKPLALYYYGNNKDSIQKIEQQTSSGAFVTNQCIFHALNPYLPFGGVGNSGIGTLRGQHGFDSCSHLKPIMYADTFNGKVMETLLPPFDKQKYNKVVNVLKYGNIKLGNVKKGLALGLGGPLALLFLSKFTN